MLRATLFPDSIGAPCVLGGAVARARPTARSLQPGPPLYGSSAALQGDDGDLSSIYAGPMRAMCRSGTRCVAWPTRNSGETIGSFHCVRRPSIQSGRRFCQDSYGNLSPFPRAPAPKLAARLRGTREEGASMCGIVGYTGTSAAPRTSWSAGSGAGSSTAATTRPAVAPVEQDGELQVVHRKGKVTGLAHARRAPRADAGTCGIGHTRWATHGTPSARRTRIRIPPATARVAVVHNGIIENFAELREELQGRGHVRSPARPTPRSSRTWWRRTLARGPAVSCRPCARLTDRLVGAYAHGGRVSDRRARHPRGRAQGLAARGGPGRRRRCTWPATSSP